MPLLTEGTKSLWHRKAALIPPHECRASLKRVLNTALHTYLHLVVPKETTWVHLPVQTWCWPLSTQPLRCLEPSKILLQLHFTAFLLLQPGNYSFLFGATGLHRFSYVVSSVQWANKPLSDNGLCWCSWADGSRAGTRKNEGSIKPHGTLATTANPSETPNKLEGPMWTNGSFSNWWLWTWERGPMATMPLLQDSVQYRAWLNCKSFLIPHVLNHHLLCAQWVHGTFLGCMVGISSRRYSPCLEGPMIATRHPVSPPQGTTPEKWVNEQSDQKGGTNDQGWNEGRSGREGRFSLCPMVIIYYKAWWAFVQSISRIIFFLTLLLNWSSKSLRPNCLFRKMLNSHFSRLFFYPTEATNPHQL